MTSEEIYEMTSTAVGFNISKKTRKREYVYAQSVANKLSKIFTNESLAKIGENCNKDHASVLSNIRTFDTVYKYQKDPINVLKIYNNLHQICKVKYEAEHDEQIDLNLNNILEENILLHERLKEEKQKRIDSEYAYRKVKHKVLKSQHPLLHLLHNIPEEHIESVKLKLDTIIKCLPKKNLSQINNANN